MNEERKPGYYWVKIKSSYTFLHREQEFERPSIVALWNANFNVWSIFDNRRNFYDDDFSWIFETPLFPDHTCPALPSEEEMQKAVSEFFKKYPMAGPSLSFIEGMKYIISQLQAKPEKP